LLIINNLSSEASQIHLDLKHFNNKKVFDLFSDDTTPIIANQENSFELAGYGYRWFKLD
jgi:hypothetical protein